MQIVRGFLSVALLLLLCASQKQFVCFGAESSPLTGVTAANLDTAAFAQWIDGKETPIPLPEREASKGATIVVWTDKSGPIHTGVSFGEANATGLRHLRIGFKAPVVVGSVLVRAGGTVSFFKSRRAISRRPR